MNICLKISYLGGNYFGFQRQKNHKTIQGVIEKTFFKIFKREINIIGCSRTDSGVHALDYYCNFHIEDFNVSPLNIKNAMNSNLPYDIRIFDCYICSDDFNSRYNAIKKEYEYRIFNGEVMPPLNFLNHAHFKMKLDFESMEKCVLYFKGEHDFKGFMSRGSNVKNTIRKIYKSEIYKTGDIIVYNIEGNGFLYNMVRIIVGTLIMVGQGKIKPYDIPYIIKSGDRELSGFVSDAKGLTLKKVCYDN